MTKDNWFQIPLFIPGDGDQRRVSVKKIFIVDPHTMVRDGIKRILENTAGFSVVGEAENGIEILTKLETLDCDCVLFDISHQDGEGLNILSKVKKMRPNLPVLVLSVYPEGHQAVQSLRAGADGYVTKEKTLVELLEAIRKVSDGKKYISHSLAEKLTFERGQVTARRPLHEKLSKRELQVLCLIASGKTVKEIAKQLSLSIHTIHTYRSRLRQKMNVTTDAEMIYYAIKKGLVE